MTNIGKSGTFALNKMEPVHRWYPYIEGYSSCLVERELDKILAQSKNITAIYDPFHGTGTTGLVGTMRGIMPYYSESNPFMRFVAETKTNAFKALSPGEALPAFKRYALEARNLEPDFVNAWDGFEKYFDAERLRQVLSIRRLILTEENDAIRNLLMLALSAILVKASKMVRRGDLRYATPKEYQPENVTSLFVSKLLEMTEDFPAAHDRIVFPLLKTSDDARDTPARNAFDCVITSPPYLNGTNYIRNTKLELN